MRDIFFLSSKNNEENSICKQLEPYFYMKEFNYDYDTLIDACKEFKPIMFLCYVSKTSDEEKSILCEIEKKCPSQTKFLVFGQQEDLNGVSIDGAATLATPFTFAEFVTYLLNMRKDIPFFQDAVKSEEKIIELRRKVDPDARKAERAEDELLREAEKNKPHILVIDDDIIMLRTLMNWLKEKYKVSVVKSGSQGIQFIQKEIPALILLDYEMPYMDGPETMKNIRDEERFKNIPIIFLTGVNDSEMIKKALSYEPDGYLLKSSGKDALIMKIDAVLGKK